MTQPSVMLLLGRYSHHEHMGIARCGKERGWHINTDWIANSILPENWDGDGIIYAIDAQPKLAGFIRRNRVPRVDLSFSSPDLDAVHVVGDHEAIGAVGAEHFLARGFRHFAWYSNRNNRVVRMRIKGFQSRLREAGHHCVNLGRTRRSGSWKQHASYLSRKLTELPKPLAVLAFNDYEAANVIDSTLQAGLLVPDDVAVLGIDNEELVCETAAVPLSSVNHDLERIGYEGACWLDRLMRGDPAPPEPVRIPPKGVTVRQSTDMLAVQDADVAAALRFLKNNLHRPIGVPDIVAATQCSRRKLEQAFKAHLSRSIIDELSRLRLDQIKQQLEQTQLPIREISARAGFSRPQYMNRVFKKATGETPQRYRRMRATFPSDNAAPSSP